MKTNEAPEKIYLQEPTKVRTQKMYDNDIEYVRKDAFIEKTVGYIANNMQCNGYNIQTKAKFIRDFKKYMKGE